MFYLYSATGDCMIVLLLFFSQSLFLTIFIRMRTVYMKFFYTLVAWVSFCVYVRMDMNITFFENTKIMLSPFFYVNTNDPAIFAHH